MKTLTTLPLLFTFVLLFSACGSSSDTANDQKRSNDKVGDSKQADNKPSKELIGKTVGEYQKIVEEQSPDSASASNDNKPVEGSVIALDEPVVEKGFTPLKWEGLIAPGFDADAILKKYDPLIQTLKEGSDEANELYKTMQAEYDKAPANEALANKKVSIPGFIAPLEQNNGIISEFLLVPYFGACIHSPAPPANQTVHVKVASQYGISVDDAYDPIWVSGELQIDKSTTDIGTAGYKVVEAKIQKYDMEN